MRKIFRLLTAVLILVLFTAPAFSALRFKTHTKYTLYIGMNDGKTGKPVYQKTARKPLALAMGMNGLI